MSKETSAVLARARADEEAARKSAGRVQQECLDDIAAGLKERVDDLAKKLAHSQPDVTKRLGKAGIQELKSDLATACAELAEAVRGAARQVKWPVSAGDFATISGRDVRSAVFDFFYGPRANTIAAVFEKHGYDTLRRPRSTYQNVVHPHSLYNDDAWFQPVADALNELHKAERKSAKAKAADDKDIVDGLWG